MRARPLFSPIASAALAILLLGQWQCVFLPEEDETGAGSPAPTPVVKIIAGAPPDSSGVDYRITFEWIGWEGNRLVDLYEWAIDDTTLESSWHPTTRRRDRFKFRATRPPADPEDPRFEDWHRFFVRAVGGDGARSKPDWRLFNAKTIAPRSWFTSCESPDLELCWEGEDLDGSDPDLRPAFYEYKLARLRHNDPRDSVLAFGENLLLPPDAPDPAAWIRVGPNTTSACLADGLWDGGLYVWALRAMDEAGAVEPPNTFVFEQTDPLCGVTATVRVDGFGARVFTSSNRSPPPRWQLTVPAQAELMIRWSGEVHCCGRSPPIVNYGFDVPDPDGDDSRDPEGQGGWFGWHNGDRLRRPVAFPVTDRGKVHNFFLKMRDRTGEPRSEVLCWIEITIDSFGPSRSILIVDDATLPTAYADDATHDAVRDRVLACAWEYVDPGDHVEYFDAFNDGDRSIFPRRLEESVLRAFRLVLWNAFFHGRPASGLNRTVGDDRLTRYARSGGRLLFFGPNAVNGLARDNYYDVGDGLCAEGRGGESPGWGDDSFLWNILHLRDCVKRPEDPVRDGWVGSRSIHPAYPDIPVNPRVWDPWEETDSGPQGGVPFFEVHRRASGMSPLADDGLDTIYVARTFDQGSELNGEPSALRYAPTGTGPETDQGRAFLMMFDPLFADEQASTEAACKAVTWLVTGRDD